MSFSDLFAVMDYSQAHGILPAQAASLLAQLGSIRNTKDDVPALALARAPFIGEIEVVL